MLQAKPPAGLLILTKAIVHGFLYKQVSAEALSLDYSSDS